MRYYMRFLGIAVISSIFCFLGYKLEGSSLSSIVLLLSFNRIYLIMSHAADFFYWYFPLLLFQIFFGVYIYRHFCSASIYFFSRYCNRTYWFLKEVIILYIYCIAFLVLRVIGGILTAIIVADFKFDINGGIILFYYLAIQSLYLFSSTLIINILAILFKSNVAFGIVEGICILSTAMLFLISNFLITNSNDISPNSLWLKINLIAHLMFSVHSSKISDLNKQINAYNFSFDLNESILVFGIIAIISIIIGCVVVNKYDFLSFSEESGGY